MYLIKDLDLEEFLQFNNKKTTQLEMGKGAE